MKLRTLIIDDEPIALEKLKNYVTKVPFLELTGECGSGLEAMDILAHGGVDLVFTDISMPDLDGMEMVRSLPSPPMIVFTTAFDSYAVDSYRLSAVDYLLKPFGFADFQRAAVKALELYRTRRESEENTPSPSGNRTPGAADTTLRREGDSIFVKVDYRYMRVNLRDIRYIKGYGEYLQIYTVNTPNPLLTLSSFAAIKERLSEDFVQVHRSFVVNMNHVGQIERSRIVMDAECNIPVGDSYKNLLNDYIGSRAIGRR